jgi:hypothetical protein
MEHSTPLQKLPDGITVPTHLRDRIAFDAERRQLSFRGFMTKYTHDELLAIANDQVYRAAVERLFVLSSQEFAPPAPRRTRPLLWAGAAACVAAIALFAVGTMMLQSSGSDQTTIDSLPSTSAVESNRATAKAAGDQPTLTMSVP